MVNTTAKNEVQLVLEEYLGNRKAEKVSEELLVVMEVERKYEYYDKTFYVHQGEKGELVLTTQSIVKTKVEEILKKYLEKDDIEVCLKQIMEEADLSSTTHTKTARSIFDTGIETINIEGSDSGKYSELFKHNPVDEDEREFIKMFAEAISYGVKSFRVPVNDPSINASGNLQFVSGCIPAVGHSYEQLENLAEKNGIRLGTKNEYILFLGTIIIRLMEEGWTEKDAWYAVCTDSTKLGHYYNSENSKNNLETTGARKIVGKCDLANTYKILAKDEKDGRLWMAGGSYLCNSYNKPLAYFQFFDYDNHLHNFSVGWFVL